MSRTTDDGVATSCGSASIARTGNSATTVVVFGVASAKRTMPPAEVSATDSA